MSCAPCGASVGGGGMRVGGGGAGTLGLVPRASQGTEAPRATAAAMPALSPSSWKPYPAQAPARCTPPMPFAKHHRPAADGVAQQRIREVPTSSSGTINRHPSTRDISLVTLQQSLDTNEAVVAGAQARLTSRAPVVKQNAALALQWGLGSVSRWRIRAPEYLGGLSRKSALTCTLGSLAWAASDAAENRGCASVRRRSTVPGAGGCGGFSVQNMSGDPAGRCCSRLSPYVTHTASCSLPAFELRHRRPAPNVTLAARL